MGLLILRHGETEGNHESVHQGMETPLNTIGIEQARAIGIYLLTNPLNVICTSQALRTMQTALVINDVLKSNGLDAYIFRTEILNGIRRPSSVIGHSKLSPQTKDTVLQAEANFGLDVPYEDEETYLSALSRADLALDMARTYQALDLSLLMVTHGSLMKLMMARMAYGTKLTPELLKSFPFWSGSAITNTALVKVNDAFLAQSLHTGMVYDIERIKFTNQGLKTEVHRV